MYTKRAGKIAQLEEMLDKDVYVLCHNRRNDAYIDGTMIDVLRRMMLRTKRRDGAALIIQTPGGDLNESYYIGEFFREYYDYTEAYVVSDCYSGGTIIALSTDNIYLSRSGCLGPIDIQRYKFQSEDNNWYPSLTGNVGALLKAEGEGKITKLQKDKFGNNMDVLATYYKELYTYKELVGENVKKHCLDESNFDKVWEYLAAINISHGIPLTYKRLNQLGLDVNLMAWDAEQLIRTIIFDVEHEFGDLKEKSVLYDFFNKAPAASSAQVTSCLNQSLEAKGNKSGKPKKRSNNSVVEHEYSCGKAKEKLAVIETSVLGFMQSKEVAITFEDIVPIYMTVVSSGWEEEVNNSLIDENRQEQLNTVLDYFAGMAKTDIDWDSLSDEEYDEVLKQIFEEFSPSAINALKLQGVDTESMSASELNDKVVDYLINTTDLISFEDDLEVKLVQYANVLGIDYDTAGTYMRIQLYEQICDIAQKILLENSDEEFVKKFESMSEDEQAKTVVEYIMNSDMTFEKGEEE